MKLSRCALAALWLGVALPSAAGAEPVSARAVDEAGLPLSVAPTYAALSRTLPRELGGLPGTDEEALSFLLVGEPSASFETVEALTRDRAGRPLDVIHRLRAEPAVCPDGVAPELVCRRTPALRLVTDALEREHVALKSRSLRAELGGTLQLTLAGRVLVDLPVAGPGGAGERFQARLRTIVLRSGPGALPALGGGDAEARRIMSEELRSAAGLWAQCGIELLPAGREPVELLEVPRTQLLAVGCGVAQPASGGRIALLNGKRKVSLVTAPGESPVSVALRLSEALGPGAQVFENQRSFAEGTASADVLLRGPARWLPDGDAPISSDPTLRVCAAELDLNRGLPHFRDGDAFVGTLEERALLRAFDDGDPRTIEVLVVPRFAGDSRIGESFIVSPGSSLSSSVIVDRSAIGAGARSFALAHELGHVLLAMPGHPDDFGVDQSWSLMDADVADPTIFGPRRLSAAECRRALVQSGPSGRVPLLERAPPLKTAR